MESLPKVLVDALRFPAFDRADELGLTATWRGMTDAEKWVVVVEHAQTERDTTLGLLAERHTVAPWTTIACVAFLAWGCVLGALGMLLVQKRRRRRSNTHR